MTYYIDPYIEGDTGFVNSFTEDERNEIRLGFSEWAAASKDTCIKVDLTEIYAPANGPANTSHINVHFGPGSTGRTQTDWVSSGTPNYYILGPAEIYISMNQFGRWQSGYTNMMLKATLHEFGHTMGFAHVEKWNRIKGHTVMNVYDPNNVNDTDEFMPTSFNFTCDRDAINTRNP